MMINLYVRIVNCFIKDAGMLVTIHGKPVSLFVDNVEHQNCGFYTTRFVKTDRYDHAAEIAKKQVINELQRLAQDRRLSISDKMKLELELVEYIKVRRSKVFQGFSFYFTEHG